MSEETPAMIGKYRVVNKIAQGGMGVVYKAVHPSLKRDVVIKKMTMRSNQMAKERFKKEAQILLDMQSPYIVHLFDYFTEGPYRYMVEEYVDGLALDKLIKKQTIVDPLVALLIVQDACYALKFAHAKGIVHRDIKPGNILISRRAEIKLADFGIASDENESDSEKTQAGVTLGTPAYMPPEQFENSSAVDCRADIYALGVMLYEMVTGTKPYPSEYSQENIARIKRGKYLNPKKIDKTIPDVVCKLIKKMLKPKARQRFQSVNPIIKIIKNYLKKYDTHAIRVELAKIVINPKPHKVARFVQKKNPWKSFFIFIITTACIAGAGFYLWTQGFIHRYVLRTIYTPVVITMKIPEAASPASKISAQAVFFKYGTKIEQVADSDRQFYEGSASKNGVTSVRLGSKAKSYVIKPVYLKPGEYRAKIVVGSNVWWKTFTVGREEIIIKIDNFSKLVRPIDTVMSACDAADGKDLTSKCRFSVFYKGKWVSVDSVPKEAIISGTGDAWKFKAECEGYEEEIFSLLIDWYQDTVYCNFSLKKK
ncbi:serine/threonine-protein kinase [Treponema sp.]|uniref:serine/threonine protein kinase n=1 Tax=Treponema sp. TaxID=166 RepID=UPI00298DEDAA|nr:serine/threonine-protein kinase [Treponema sp.]MCR5613719.1 serine/threonine protein kinase [Treponema sp.]